ncbi:DUF5103 domain-containing protein [Lutibacter sp. TH_r2]|uniref:type IX secretion system plug protein n=1 Tax=Lutibacter sp. TH_r2 TaxID=3082083 RepID=UPI002953CD23|nr:type IX secretion system plug protein domain-containing protein [Lutibacter sp. TH_r2]MDV7186896.1 DUF5103 domain-containing protein [Lutibacter sp. TH_r2]
MLVKYKLLFILLFGFGILYSQEIENDPDYIKTVILKPNTVNYYAPIMKLGQLFTFSFDDLNADERDYYYKIEHCDIDWNPSNLMESEFLNGYAEERIRDYENSFNTLQYYTHYSVTFPNDDTQIKISGNYLISLLNEDEEVVLTRRFVIYKPEVTVAVAISKSRDLKYYDTKQAVEFTINHSNFTINNANDEIFPVILQNNNWQTAISGLKPQFYRGTQLLYKYNKETSFWAGNEFLYFDSKSIRNPTLNIGRVELGRELYHSYLYTNNERIDQPYTLFEDVNGNFIVRILNNDNSSTDADYSWVHFSLESLEKLGKKEIYVSGNFNNWQLNESNKLTYNLDTKLYETKILLKQGFYNYQYVTKTVDGKISNKDIDGSFYQTENDYTVIVYYKKFGSRYTEVIGVGYGNSTKLIN